MYAVRRFKICTQQITLGMQTKQDEVHRAHRTKVGRWDMGLMIMWKTWKTVVIAETLA
jgi:hypothetical protein